jgi:glycosyltransferase involved in cell wall biosynthesis
VCASEAVAERFRSSDATPHVVPLRHFADAIGGAKVWRLARGFDVVHAQDRRSGLWTRLWPQGPGSASRVYTVHGLPDPYLPPPVGRERPRLRDRIAYRGLDAALARRTDALVVPSLVLAEALASRLGFPAERLTVIPNGIEPSGSGHAGSRVGTISVVEPVKGLDVFVRAARLVVDRRPDARFTVFGDGSGLPALRRLASTLELGEAVAFPGHVPVQTALGDLGVYVLCSWFENCPMSLLEAMGANVPAVATAVGGVPEIADGGVAQLVAPGDPALLAEAILRLLDDPAAARRQAAAARLRVEERFTASHNARATLALYRRLRETAA